MLSSAFFVPELSVYLKRTQFAPMNESSSIKQILRASVVNVLNDLTTKSFLAAHRDRILSSPIFSDTGSLGHYGARPIRVIGIGKMADSLVWEFVQMFELSNVRGIVSSPYESDVLRVNGITYYRGGHPVPNEESLLAAEAALEILAAVEESVPVVYLISGGGSACFELPNSTIKLADLQSAYQTLVNSGANICEINQLRQKLSMVKGGKLAVACNSKRQLALVVSDVPGTLINSVSSGPTSKPLESDEGIESLIKKYPLLQSLPKSVMNLLSGDGQTITNATDDSVFEDNCESVCIGSNDDAIESAKKYFQNCGWQVKVDRRFDESAREVAAAGMLKSLDDMHGSVPCCVIGGGEVGSVVVGGGKGGRNQAFVLECVPLIAGNRVAVMSFGTDGIDGNSPAAGAIADGQSMERAKQTDADPSLFEKESNSYEFFKRFDETIETGPTQVNVRDIRVLVRF